MDHRHANVQNMVNAKMEGIQHGFQEPFVLTTAGQSGCVCAEDLTSLCLQMPEYLTTHLDRTVRRQEEIKTSFDRLIVNELRSITDLPTKVKFSKDSWDA